MTEDHEQLDRELRELGARWRAEHPVDDELRGLRVPDGFADRSGAGTRWWGVAAAAAAVVAVVLGTVALLPDRDEAAPASGPDAVVRLDCTRRPAPTTPAAPVVAEGAVTARLCGRIAGPLGFAAAWPQDTLLGGVEDLVAAVNAMTPVTGGPPCGGSPAVRFDLALGYADGASVVLEGMAHAGCTELVVRGVGTWTGPVDLRAVAVRLIDAQRTRTGAGEPIAPICPPTWQRLAGTVDAGPVTEATDVAVTACRYRLDAEPRTPEDGTGELVGQVVLPDPARIIGLALGGPTADPCTSGKVGTEQDVLVVRDGYGDIHVVPTEPCWAHDLTGTSSYPSPALGAAVGTLLDGR